MVSTVIKWAASVPDNFRLTFKLWKAITHNKFLEFDESDVERFITTINNIWQKKGYLLIQFTPSLHSQNMKQLNKLLDAIKKFDPLSNGKWYWNLEMVHGITRIYINLWNSLRWL